MELSIERTPDGDYVRTEACEAMNIAVERLIDRNIGQWESHPSPELTEQFLLQIEQQAAKAVTTKQSNDRHHMYRNKPHGWSPTTQVVLYVLRSISCTSGNPGKTVWNHRQTTVATIRGKARDSRPYRALAQANAKVCYSH
jgi:hypothetical protein